jgi:hypothetical protein
MNTSVSMTSIQLTLMKISHNLGLSGSLLFLWNRLWMERELNESSGIQSSASIREVSDADDRQSSSLQPGQTA